MRLINGDSVKRELDYMKARHIDDSNAVEIIEEALLIVKGAKDICCVVPVVEGYWIESGVPGAPWKCSECESLLKPDMCGSEPDWIHCPICGARLEGTEP